MSLGQALDQAGREHLGPSPRTLAFLLGYPGDPVLALFLDARNANVRRRLLAEMGLGNHVNHIGIRSTWFDTLNTFLVQLTEREQNAFYYHGACSHRRSRECPNCQAGDGPFSACHEIVRPQGGSCTNCYYLGVDRPCDAVGDEGNNPSNPISLA